VGPILFVALDRIVASKHNSPTVCVTFWWVEQDNATLLEPTLSHDNCLQNAQTPTVGRNLLAKLRLAFSHKKNMRVKTYYYNLYEFT
jgi:hypothetical protein